MYLFTCMLCNVLYITLDRKQRHFAYYITFASTKGDVTRAEYTVIRKVHKVLMKH